MRSDDYRKLDKIASSYFQKTDILFRTIHFSNIAISHSSPTQNPELSKAFLNLKEIFEKTSPVISDKGIHHDLVMKHMSSLCFSSLVSAFEDFIIEVASIILRREPERLHNLKCEYRVFASLDQDSLTDYLITEKLASLTFGSAREYINKLCNLVCLEKRKVESLVKSFVEMKARRDVGVHNNWVMDERYLRKIAELNIAAPETNYLKPDLDYFSRTYNVCGDMVKIITNNISSTILHEGDILY